MRIYIVLSCVWLSVHAVDLKEDFIRAVRENNIQRIQGLIDAGIAIDMPNDYGCTMLMSAVYKGNEDTIKLLLKYGAHVNAQDERGNTALMWTVAAGHKETARLLLTCGAQLNTQNRWGETALISAICKKNREIAELLLQHKAATDIQVQWGYTALTYAAAYGNKDMVELLLKYGAKVTLKNSEGKTTLDLVKEMFDNPKLSQEKRAYKEIGRILLEAYIKQKSLEGAQQASKRALLKQIIEHQHTPDAHKMPREVIDIIWREIKK